VKIALVTETFPPEINGVAMTLHRVVGGLSTRGHELEVVCPRRSDREEWAKTESFAVHMVPGLPIPRYDDLRFGLPAAGNLKRRWRANPPNLIHIATEGPLGWSAVRAAKALKIPFITTFHTNFHAYGKHYGYGFLNRGVLWWLKKIRREARSTFVPSEVLRDELAKEGFERLSILSRGVDTQLYDPAKRDDALRASWGADADTPVALFVGRVAGEKNVPLTIEAFRAMQTELPDLKLVIVGDGPERKRLEAAHQDIIFAGMRRGEDLARHYASGDCFLFASVTETFGNVVTEAMASGLVALTYDYAAGHKFIEDGVNGALASFDDAVAYRQRAVALAQTRDAWSSLRQAARETALSISWDSVLDGFEREISAIVARSGASPSLSVSSASPNTSSP
jgi:glycosyltransferase involved in cell wall biosynthesis